MKSACAFALLFGSAAALEIRSRGELQPLDPSNDALPDVPKSLGELPDVPNSMGGLPELSSMLEGQSDTLSGINSQATQLQKQIQSLESQNTFRLYNEKKIFDLKLEDQEEQNKELAKQNNHLAKEIIDMNQTNANILKDAAELQKGNADRRKELKLLKEHLEASVSFMAHAYTTSDDSNEADLEVLKSAGEVPQELSLISISEGKGREKDIHEDSGLDFIKLAESAAGQPDEEAAAIVTNLQTGLNAMQKQGLASEEKLKAMFLQHFRVGNARHSALIAQNKVLQATLDSMKKHSERLRLATKHLTATQKQLDAELHDGSIFLRRVGRIAGEKPAKGVVDLEDLQAKLHAAMKK